MNELLAEAWDEFAAEELSRDWQREQLRLLLDGPLAEVAPDDLSLHARRILKWLAGWDRDTATGVAELLEMAVLAHDPTYQVGRR